MRVILLMIVLAGSGLADTLTLRDGRVIEGTFAGGDERQVRMTAGGKVEAFDVTTVAKLEFNAPPPPAAQAVAGSTGTLNGIAALVAIVAAAPNVDKAPEFVPNPFMTLPAASQPKTK